MSGRSEKSRNAVGGAISGLLGTFVGIMIFGGFGLLAGLLAAILIGTIGFLAGYYQGELVPLWRQSWTQARVVTSGGITSARAGVRHCRPWIVEIYAIIQRRIVGGVRYSLLRNLFLAAWIYDLVDDLRTNQKQRVEVALTISHLFFFTLNGSIIVVLTVSVSYSTVFGAVVMALLGLMLLICIGMMLTYTVTFPKGYEEIRSSEKYDVFDRFQTELMNHRMREVEKRGLIRYTLLLTVRLYATVLSTVRPILYGFFFVLPSLIFHQFGVTLPLVTLKMFIRNLPSLSDKKHWLGLGVSVTTICVSVPLFGHLHESVRLTLLASMLTSMVCSFLSVMSIPFAQWLPRRFEWVDKLTKGEWDIEAVPSYMRIFESLENGLIRSLVRYDHLKAERRLGR
jgi:hypothetical protein